MKSTIMKTSWQERYHAAEVYTLRCKVLDQPGMLGKLITAIGKTQTHVGNISTSGLDSHNKIRDVQVFCADKQHLTRLLEMVSAIDGIEVLHVNDDVLEMHRRGVIDVKSRVAINNLSDLRMVYTPGVASVCNKIVENPALAWNLTGLCDRVAIVTNGTAVLGLGDIGVSGSLPVMEGKAAIFAEFANISAFPILVDSKKPDEVVETIVRIAAGFGAIQLEDIAAPACFEIEEKLRTKLDIPVFHDDQHGTATVTLATLINALQRTGRKPQNCSAIIAGAGAAGYAIAMILREFGIGDIVVYDSIGPLYAGRTKSMNPYKQKLAKITNPQDIQGYLMEGFKGRDIFIGVARPNMVSKDMIAAMAPRPLVFPLSNPVGEISVDDAYEAGAGVAADGRTINNALAYPGLFRGALDAQARDITLNMQLAAAHTLADLAPEDALLPDMLDKTIHQRVAAAVAKAYV
ncbi:MAG: NAD-dependent malic enzyme [Sedimentisphaerales bacterium]|nr:NAD-dependent malic enzyme [Sedimentisphaerales bacterium]